MPAKVGPERQLWRILGNAMTLWKGQSKRGHALVGFHAAAASPAPPMKKLRAGSSHCNQAFGRLHDLGSHHAPPALGRVAVRWLSRCRRQSGRDDHRRAARLPAWRLERRDDSRQIGDFHVHALNPTQILAQILNFVW